MSHEEDERPTQKSLEQQAAATFYAQLIEAAQHYMKVTGCKGILIFEEKGGTLTIRTLDIKNVPPPLPQPPRPDKKR